MSGKYKPRRLSKLKNTKCPKKVYILPGPLSKENRRDFPQVHNWLYKKGGPQNVHPNTQNVHFGERAVFDFISVNLTLLKWDTLIIFSIHAHFGIPKKGAFFHRLFEITTKRLSIPCTFYCTQNVHFAHYVHPKRVPSFNDNGFIDSKLEKWMYTFAHYVHPKSVPSFSNLEPNVWEVTILFKMYTLHILCTQKVCLLSTTMYSQRWKYDKYTRFCIAHFGIPKSVPSFKGRSE